MAEGAHRGAFGRDRGGAVSDITVYFRDGSVQTFPHQGRPGGSYTKRVRYEGSFAIIRDEWDNETTIPADRIDHIKILEGGHW